MPVVGVVTVRAEPLQVEIELVGELRADESVVLKPEIAGVIAAVEFLEGQAVAKGDVLFRLRDAEQVARLREAQARLALARDEHGRTLRLARQNAAAAVQLERAAAELAVARARTQLERVELERTRIAAPFDGVAGARLVSPGERVTTDTSLVRVDAIDPLQVVFTVPEQVVPEARADAPVTVRVAPFPEQTFEGRIFFVAPSLDSANRRLALKGRLANAEGRLRPGMFARVGMKLGQRQALLVPEESVVLDGSGSFVWRLDDGDVAERVRVELGVHRDGRVEVVSGLHPGERVVSAGTHKVDAGARVEPVPARAAEDGGAGLPPDGSLGGGGR